MTAVGRAWVPCPGHEGANAVAPHQSLDPPAAHAAIAQLGMDPWAAITLSIVAMDTPDLAQQVTIDDRALAFRARAPGVVAGRRDAEHGAHDPHRIVDAAILDEAESHVRTPAKIAIDFFKMSRSIRSRSFSRCRRAISAAWSADGSVACVVGRRAAAVGSRPAPRNSTQRRNTESRRPSSLATDPIERPLEATRSTACRL